MRAIRRAAIFVAAIALVTGCATTAEDVPSPTVSLQPIEYNRISPASSPGARDIFYATLTAAAGEETMVSLVSVVVTDDEGVEFYRLTEPTADTERTPGESQPFGLPTRVAWNGADDQGNYVPDGTYQMYVEVTDTLDQYAESNRVEVVVNNSPPNAEVTMEYNIVSPDGDGNRDVLPIRHRVSEGATWSGVILDDEGDTVRSWAWESQIPATLRWDGTGNNGETVADGRYRYRLAGADLAGNSVVRIAENIRVSTSDFAATIERGTPAFSPDGDGLRDESAFELSVQRPQRVDEWQLVVSGPTGETVLQQSGSGAPPARIGFSGRADDGTVLPQGGYTAQLDLTYRNGDQVSATTRRALTLDLNAPSVELSLQADRFSPRAGAGTITIPQQGEGAARWSGAVIPAGQEDPLLTVEWESDLPESFSWNGQTNEGQVAATGEYRYRLRGRDRAGNSVVETTDTFLLDRDAPELAVEVAPLPFTPDGDGRNDVLEISIETADRAGIASWQARIVGPTGNTFVALGGEGEPPAPIEWDGTGEDGTMVESARDYTASVSIADAAGNRSSTERTIEVGILVREEEDGDLRFRISGIRFAPFEADYRDLEDPERARNNQQTLDRVAEILGEYPDRRVRIEGHAVHIFTDPERREREQELTLLPLSRDRAEAIREALVQRGIDAGRLTVSARGGSEPLVPHTNLEDRWRNRRVEFELVQGG